MPPASGPASPSRSAITEQLLASRAGDREALQRLGSLLYDDLRRIASRQLRREGPAETLQTTSLVHEAYLRLVDGSRCGWESRGHFFAAAAQAMRRLLVDRARERAAQKRGSGVPDLPIEAADGPAGPAAVWAESDHADRVLAVDEALARLAGVDPQLVSVVELRFFVGLTLAETAAVLDISPAATWREWVAAKAFLATELAVPPGASAGSA